MTANDRITRCPHPVTPQRTQGQIEAEISQGLLRFKRTHIGRGPSDIHTHLMDDMVIVRMADALTPQEQILARSGAGELLKQLRARLLESGRPELDRMLRQATGRQLVRMYGDLCPESAERLLVFILGDTSSGTVN